jgi:F0F1-type ATP synthase assembly protein I
MSNGPLNPKELGFYITLGQVGLEMVVPLILGLVLDSTLGWTPWATVCGAALGFIAGLGHLIWLLNSHNQTKSTRPPRDTP